MYRTIADKQKEAFEWNKDKENVERADAHYGINLGKYDIEVLEPEDEEGSHTLVLHNVEVMTQEHIYGKYDMEEEDYEFVSNAHIVDVDESDYLVSVQITFADNDNPEETLIINVDKNYE